MMPMHHMYSPTPSAGGSAHNPAGGRLVATDGRELPLQGAQLRVDAGGGAARVVLEQRFANPHDEPLTVTYQLPLPADGAVSGFAFTVGETRIVGEIDRRESARERFEEALIEGRSAALLEQDRSSVFTQEVGNIPPRQEVIAELTVDQPLKWLSDGQWEWRFPTVVAPRYLGAEGRVADAEQITVDVADGELEARAALELRIRDQIASGGGASSPSHALVTSVQDAALRVALADEQGSGLDRDVVVRWPVAGSDPGVSLDRARPAADGGWAESAYGVLTLVPPQQTGSDEQPGSLGRVARDLIVLIDTSGSMMGEPLAQAKRVVAALIDGLGPQDQLELIEFGWRPRRFKKQAVRADERNKAAALKWLRKLSASGGTEMREGIIEALRGLRTDAQRQVLLISDGLIGFEEEIVAEVLHRLPAGCRVHCLGVGSGVNRSLTGPVARAGAGCELVVAPGEDVEPLMARLLHRMHEPLVVDLRLEGTAVRTTASVRLPDLFAGAPVLLPVELSPDGGAIVIRGRTAHGQWHQRVDVPATGHGEGSAAITALFARERVEDLEMRRAAGEPAGRLDEQIEALGLGFGISTRLTSWIAVSQEATVDPTQASRKITQPQQLPHGMSAEGLGLRGGMPVAMPLSASQAGMIGAVAPMALGRAGRVRASRGFGMPMAPPPPASAPRPPGAPPACAAPPPPASPAPPGPPPRRRAEETRADERRAAPKRGKSKGMLRRLKDAFVGEEHEEKAAFVTAGFEDADELAESPREGAVLQGRIVLHREGFFTVEAEVDLTLDWTFVDTVEVELADGTVVYLELDESRSTASSMLEPGQRLRLTLRLDAPLGSEPVHLTAGPVDIDL